MSRNMSRQMLRTLLRVIVPQQEAGHLPGMSGWSGRSLEVWFNGQVFFMKGALADMRKRMSRNMSRQMLRTLCRIIAPT